LEILVEWRRNRLNRAFGRLLVLRNYLYSPHFTKAKQAGIAVKFSKLAISKELKKGLKEIGFDDMFPIQEKAISLILNSF